MNENQEEPLFYDTLIVKTKRSSKKERRADALALRAEERRDAISCGEKQIFIDPQISEWGNPAGQTPVTVW